MFFDSHLIHLILQAVLFYQMLDWTFLYNSQKKVFKLPQAFNFWFDKSNPLSKSMETLVNTSRRKQKKNNFNFDVFFERAVIWLFIEKALLTWLLGYLSNYFWLAARFWTATSELILIASVSGFSSAVNSTKQ